MTTTSDAVRADTAAPIDDGVRHTHPVVGGGDGALSTVEGTRPHLRLGARAVWLGHRGDLEVEVLGFVGDKAQCRAVEPGEWFGEVLEVRPWDLVAPAVAADVVCPVWCSEHASDPETGQEWAHLGSVTRGDVTVKVLEVFDPAESEHPGAEVSVEAFDFWGESVRNLADALTAAADLVGGVR